MTPVADLPEALAAMRLTLARLGVSMPPAPAALQERISQIGEAWFTTRDLPEPLYRAGAFIDEFLSGAASDYLVIGIDGYGMMNYYFHYYLVFGEIGIFLQSRLVDNKGGDRLVGRLNAQLYDVEKVLAAPVRPAAAMVDVIGARYVAEGGAETRGGAIRRVADPLDYYLVQAAGRGRRAAALRG